MNTDAGFIVVAGGDELAASITERGAYRLAREYARALGESVEVWWRDNSVTELLGVVHHDEIEA